MVTQKRAVFAQMQDPCLLGSAQNPQPCCGGAVEWGSGSGGMVLVVRGCRALAPCLGSQGQGCRVWPSSGAGQAKQQKKLFVSLMVSALEPREGKGERAPVCGGRDKTWG